MLPLAGDTFPKSSDELRHAIDDGLKLFGAPKGVTEIEGGFPNLSLLKIDLSGGHAGADTRPPARDIRDRQPGIEVARLEVSASPLLCWDAPVNFLLTAGSARLGFARIADGKPVLVFNTAGGGEVDVQIRRADLETLAQGIASAAAAKQGAKIEKVDVSLTTLGPRSVGFDAKVTASMFMSTTVHVTGWIEVDDALNANFSRLNCEASGMIGSMAAGFIRPHLVKLQAKPFPLASLPLGGLKVRDLKIDAGDPLHLQVWFEEG